MDDVNWTAVWCGWRAWPTKTRQRRGTVAFTLALHESERPRESGSERVRERALVLRLLGHGSAGSALVYSRHAALLAWPWSATTGRFRPGNTD